jgi:hypothetical protein
MLCGVCSFGGYTPQCLPAVVSDIVMWSWKTKKATVSVSLFWVLSDCGSSCLLLSVLWFYSC